MESETKAESVQKINEAVKGKRNVRKEKCNLSNNERFLRFKMVIGMTWKVFQFQHHAIK